LKNLFSLQTVFLVVLISILAAFFSGGLIMSIGISTSHKSEKLYTFISFIIGQASMLVPLLYYINLKKAPLFSTIRLSPISYQIFLYTILFSLGLIIISDELDRIMQVFIPAPDYITDLDQLLRPDTIVGFILLFIAVSIFAPIGEEILFRGFLQQFLEKHWKDTTKAILVTSLIFSAIHFNPYWFIQIYLLGIMLGFLTWKTNSVIPSIILHGLNNTMAMLFSFSDSAESSFYTFNGHVAPWIIVFAVIITISGFKGISQVKNKKL
tara:strand:- start:35 stop:835 length:801 start_codon:yes stop_codon:yes gene_type:complete